MHHSSKSSPSKRRYRDRSPVWTRSMQRSLGKEMLHSTALSRPEKSFIERRSQITFKAMQKLLGDKGPQSVDETPTVSLVISGGGYRAISTSCGATEALMENNVFDALTYFVGLSGSVWYMSTTYSKKSFTSLQRLKKDHDWIRGQLGEDLHFGPSKFMTSLFKSMFCEQDLVQIYGEALRDVLLEKQHHNIKLSSLQEYVGDGKVPFPIFSAAHVNNHGRTCDFWEEVEITPSEATFASYNVLVPTQEIDSVWRNGVLSESREEPPLHYIMAICGSAFAGTFRELCELGWDSIWDTIASPFSYSLQSTAGSSQSSSRTKSRVMNKDEFIHIVWKPVLRKGLEGEDISVNKAYELYVEYKKTANGEWLDDLILMSLEEQKESTPIPPKKLKLANSKGSQTQQTLMRKAGTQRFGLGLGGRNMGNFLRTGFLRNPFYEMPCDVEKYMMNGQHVKHRKPGCSKRIGEKCPVGEEKILVVDSGLGCNVPAIHVARPQRNSDVVIVIDCETKDPNKNANGFFSALKQTKQQMYDNNMNFPEIDIEKVKKNPGQEYYVFEDTDKPDCPIVIWFPLHNNGFRKLPNAPRSEEYPPSGRKKEKFNDFDVTPDSSEYSTTNLQYSPRDVDRLRELMKYNVGANIKVVKEKIAKKVAYLRTTSK